MFLGRRCFIPSTICTIALSLAVVLVFAGHVVAQSVREPRFVTVYSFPGQPDGGFPRGTLIRHSKSTLYGTTFSGGDANWGTIFKLGSDGQESIIHSFIYGPDGANPDTGLTAGPDGTLYGTTSWGGLRWGTVFELEPDGTLTTILTFNYGNGAYPTARLIRDQDGNLYGTAMGGSGKCALYGCGVVFKIDTLGQETLLHDFTGSDEDDGFGPNELLRDESRNLYGTTAMGGGEPDPGNGTIFELDAAGAYTLLYSFKGGADGARPWGGLVRDCRGNLYGTTWGGGANGNGTIFKFDRAGNLAVLYSFAGGQDSPFPNGSLVLAGSKLYGTTGRGGDYGYGSVFEVTQHGKYTVRHNFSGGSDGGYPRATLVRAPGNEMYGSPEQGGITGGPCGTFGCGTIFKIKP